MKLELVRKEFSSQATIGELLVDGEWFCYTLEDVVRDTKIAGKTAIPYGTYEVIVTMSNRFKRPLPLLQDVPNFSGVRIHSGNTSADTEGCILVGNVKAKDFIGQSRDAFNKLFPLLQTALDKDKVYLTVKTEKTEEAGGAAMGLVGVNINDIGGVFSGIGTLAKDIRQAITGELPADKKAELEQKLLELESISLNAQIEVNKAEAASASLFVSGWRPFVGWICALGVGYQFLFYPLCAKLFNIVSLDASMLMSLLLGMLGIGGMRTFEKVKGVTKQKQRLTYLIGADLPKTRKQERETGRKRRPSKRATYLKQCFQYDRHAEEKYQIKAAEKLAGASQAVCAMDSNSFSLDGILRLPV